MCVTINPYQEQIAMVNLENPAPIVNGEIPENGSFAPQSAADFVTVATSLGPLMTKRWYPAPDGKPQCDAYAKGKWFSFEQRPVAELADLFQIINSLTPQQSLILGRPRDGVDLSNARRLLYDRKEDGELVPATIEDAAHRFVLLDIDGVQATDEAGEFDPLADTWRAIACVRNALPLPFWLATCLWQWTSSAGMKHDGK